MPALKYWDTASGTWKLGAVGNAAGQYWAQPIGDGVATNFEVVHGLGTRYVTVSVYRSAPPYDEVVCDVERTMTDRVIIRTSPTVPGVGEYTVVIQTAGTQAALNTQMDAWHKVGDPGESAFQNSWVNFDGAGPYTTGPPVGFRKDLGGRVALRGLVKAGTVGAACFTLPAGYRPPYTWRWACQAFNGSTTVYCSAYVAVTPAGAVDINTPFLTTHANTWVDLGTVEFDTESVTQQVTLGAQPLDSWHFVGGAGEPAFQNSAVNLDNNAAVPGTAAQRSAKFRKYPDGRVRLVGVIKSGSNGSTVFTLPPGYRPPLTAAFVINANTAPAIVNIASDGSVQPTNVGSSIVTAWLYLDGIEFDTETVSAYASGFMGPPLVTALPANPVDGQECRYLADATNGVVWHLRYRAASASIYKWELVGGSPLTAFNPSNYVTSATSFAALGGGAVNFTLPLAGDYIVTVGARIITTAGSVVAAGAGATPLDDTVSALVASSSPNTTVGRQHRFNGLTAGGVLEVRGRSISGSAVDIREAFLHALPVRVG